jgi:hypothetical protein
MNNKIGVIIGFIAGAVLGFTGFTYAQSGTGKPFDGCTVFEGKMKGGYVSQYKADFPNGAKVWHIECR